jgi:hypothetical protein
MFKMTGKFTSITMLIVMVFFLAAWVMAGDLEPPAEPMRTMKTLDEIPPTWSLKIPSKIRFVVLDKQQFSQSNGEAVLDKETGLVWTTNANLISPMEWKWATVECYRLNVNFRMGWRLPTIYELASLVDGARSGPALPVQHPFADVQFSSEAGNVYWSSTTHDIDSTQGQPIKGAMIVDFDKGWVQISPQSDEHHVWCVRGGK